LPCAIRSYFRPGMRRLATTARFLALMMGDERMPLSSQDDADRLDGVSGVGASEKQLSIEDQLRATVNVIPGHVWYATPSGALIFVNSRSADYLGLPKDHPLRFGIDLGLQTLVELSLLLFGHQRYADSPRIHDNRTASLEMPNFISPRLTYLRPRPQSLPARARPTPKTRDVRPGRLPRGNQRPTC